MINTIVRERLECMTSYLELWDITCDGTHIHMKEVKKVNVMKLVSRNERSMMKMVRETVRKAIEQRNYLFME